MAGKSLEVGKIYRKPNEAARTIVCMDDMTVSYSLEGLLSFVPFVADRSAFIEWSKTANTAG